MKKRINVQFLIVVSIAIIVTAAAAICIFYNTFKREIMENLKTTAYTIKIYPDRNTAYRSSIMTNLHRQGLLL